MKSLVDKMKPFQDRTNYQTLAWYMLTEGEITQEQHDVILNMIFSPDPENFEVAKQILNNLKPNGTQ